MDTPVEEAKGGETLALRQEARPALGARVPLVLAVAVALLGGGLLGYSWRAFIDGDACHHRCPMRVVRQGVLAPGEGRTPPPRLILLGDEQAPDPCGSGAPETAAAAGSAASTSAAAGEAAAAAERAPAARKAKAPAARKAEAPAARKAKAPAVAVE